MRVDGGDFPTRPFFLAGQGGEKKASRSLALNYTEATPWSWL
jgi:hypothetical protein